MAQYRYDPDSNTYVLEDAENFSLVDGQDHTDPNAGVTGNAFDNTIIGNDADNRLDGGEGADILEGGSGNDAYAVDGPGDVVIEAEDGGSSDSVTAYISYTLPDHVEVLILQGFENIRGTGNGAPYSQQCRCCQPDGHHRAYTWDQGAHHCRPQQPL